MARKQRLQRAAIRRGHLSPQPPPRLGEFDADCAVIAAVEVAMTSDPTLFFEAIESPTHTRRREPKIGGNIERASLSPEALERRQHIKPPQRDVPFGSEFFVDSAFDLTD